MQPCPCSAWILRSCEWGVAVTVTPHPRGPRHQGPGPSFVHAGPACKTSNFQHNAVSLQGLVGAMISHSTVHPMLLPTWGAGPHPGVVVPSEVQGHTEQSPGPAAPGSCSFLLAREADKNINFTEQQPPLQSPQRAGSTEKCWVQLNPNQNQIKTREKRLFPVLGTLGESWDSGEPVGATAWDGHGETPSVPRPGPPALSMVQGQGDQCWHLTLCPHQASLPGWGDAGCRLRCGGAVLWAAGNRSCPCHGAALGRGSGCLA